MAQPAISVVVPTGGRRTLALALRALADQTDAPPFQVVVVFDGPSDDAVSAFDSASYPFDTLVLEQSHRGLHHARDLGASAARGKVLLFANDDELADPHLLAAVHEGHDSGADVLQPALDIHPAATPTVVASFVRRWARQRRHRLSRGPLQPQDVSPTPLSIRNGAYRALREALGPIGFAGPGVAEDFRIGHALNRSRFRAHHLGTASCLTLVGPSVTELLDLSEEIGRADAQLARDAPELALSIARARADRWVTSERERKAVGTNLAKARRLSLDAERRLLAEARRGVVPDDALTRADRAISVRYWLGFDSRPA